MAFGAGYFSITVLALDAVLAPISSRLNIQLLGLVTILVEVTSHQIE